MQKAITIFVIIMRLFLGGMMVYGGFGKFQKASVSPAELVEKANQFNSPEKENTLQKILYISGMKQTGYFWPVLGICEIFFGLLILAQGTSFIGAMLLLPITLQIFLFHLFLEPDEIGELLMTGVLFSINLYLIIKEYPRWKHLLWVKLST